MVLPIERLTNFSPVTNSRSQVIGEIFLRPEVGEQNETLHDRCHSKSTSNKFYRRCNAERRNGNGLKPTKPNSATRAWNFWGSDWPVYRICLYGNIHDPVISSATPRFKSIERGFALRDICYESDCNFSLNNVGHIDNGT